MNPAAAAAFACNHMRTHNDETEHAYTCMKARKYGVVEGEGGKGRGVIGESEGSEAHKKCIILRYEILNDSF